MTKTQFKNEMVKRHFKCLKFKNDMIFTFGGFLINVYSNGNGYDVFIWNDAENVGYSFLSNVPLSIFTINDIHDEILTYEFD